MTLTDAIGVRHSVRTYLPETPSDEVLDFVRGFCSRPLDRLPGQHARAVLIERAVNGKVGTYGMVRNAPCFMALVYSDIDRLSPVSAGMGMEEAVLKLTATGMGTVWLGGTFNKSEISHLASLADGERVAALIPFGYPAEKERFLSRFMSRMAHSRQRRPFGDLFTVTDDTFTRALELMRLAPSALNKQPWRAVQRGRTIDFFTDGSSGFYPLDLGIGLSHFDLAAPAGRFEVLSPTCAPGLEYYISYTAE